MSTELIVLLAMRQHRLDVPGFAQGALADEVFRAKPQQNTAGKFRPTTTVWAKHTASPPKGRDEQQILPHGWPALRLRTARAVAQLRFQEACPIGHSRSSLNR